MDDNLPISAPLPNTSSVPVIPQSLPMSVSSSNKEAEGVFLSQSETMPLKEIGHDMEISPEVERVGVKMHPQTVQLPQKLVGAGVVAVGQTQPLTKPSIVLPLDDEKIAEGLKQGVTSSWRWLAEWCLRKLKGIGQGISVIHGNVTRVLVSN